MHDKIVSHPYHDLMAEAKREREIADSPEGLVLIDAVFKAVRAYSDFLEAHGVIWGDISDDPNDHELPRLKAQALVVTVDYGLDPGTIDITLKDGACDRVYGNGADPDAYGQGPPDIPHKRRED